MLWHKAFFQHGTFFQLLFFYREILGQKTNAVQVFITLIKKARGKKRKRAKKQLEKKRKRERRKQAMKVIKRQTVRRRRTVKMLQLKMLHLRSQKNPKILPIMERK